jgi:hypothetical protein
MTSVNEYRYLWGVLLEEIVSRWGVDEDKKAEAKEELHRMFKSYVDLESITSLETYMLIIFFIFVKQLDNNEIKIPHLQHCSLHDIVTSSCRCCRCGIFIMRGERRDTNSFIQDSINKHGDTYDYSLVNYVNANTKVDIICKTHGVFSQAASAHLYGRGCEKCSIVRRIKGLCKTTQQFIDEARLIHGGLYDYSKSVYIKSTQKIVVICKKHGCFMQTPSSHLSGNGCNLCSIESRRRPTHIFISKSNIIHNSKYDYSLLVGLKHVRDDDIIKIICPEHGVFHQKAGQHLAKHGCKLCYKETVWLGRHGFINMAKQKHNDFYDYSSVVYVNIDTKVKVVCPAHGEFFIRPKHHLSGYGCKLCHPRISFGFSLQSWVRYNSTINGTPLLYVLDIDFSQENFYKIGITSQSVAKRYYNSKFYYPFRILYSWTGNVHDVYLAELELKRNLKNYRYIPKLTNEGRTECFSLIPSSILQEVIDKYNLCDVK